MDALGNQTFFVIMVKDKKSIRPFTVEHEVPETREEALALVKEWDGYLTDFSVFAVYQCDPDIPRKDISEDLAVEWAEELKAGGFDPDIQNWPTFITRNVPTYYDLGGGENDHDDDRVVAMYPEAAE